MDHHGVVAIEGVDPKLDIFSIKQIIPVDNCTQFGEFDPLAIVTLTHRYDKIMNDVLCYEAEIP